jgi:hypothetical protein
VELPGGISLPLLPVAGTEALLVALDVGYPEVG